MRIGVLLASNQLRGIDGTGGLGDVPVGLAKSLTLRGDTDVRLIMPGFAEITNTTLVNRFDPAARIMADLPVPFGDHQELVDVYEMSLPNTQIPCYLIRCPQVFDARDRNTHLLNKNTPDKAILFGRAVCEFLTRYDKYRPDVIHCNDWNTGLIPVYRDTHYQDDHYFGRTACVFTTHNAGGDAFQGGFSDPHGLLQLAGLTAANVFTIGATKSLHHYNKFNFSKGGLGFADIINTVSLKYRRELMTRAFSGGLEGLFQQRANDFAGVLNGIDTTEWSPSSDTHLQDRAFSATDPVSTIQAAKRSVRDLLRQWVVPAGTKSTRLRSGDSPFALLRDDTRLIGVVSRIDSQKMPLLLEALGQLTALPDVQLVVLGNADQNDPLGISFQEQLQALCSDRLLFYDGFDIALSHLIYAACELFLVPSVFEPCGLTQLVAMRYGAVPVVRSVCGLADTVIDEQDVVRAAAANGFCFKEPVDPSELMDLRQGAELLVSTVRRALNTHGTPRWDELLINGLTRDSSWEVPAAQYMKLYHEAIRRRVDSSFFGSATASMASA